eukprot:5315698-Amphidinium_carterae.1
MEYQKLAKQMVNKKECRSTSKPAFAFDRFPADSCSKVVAENEELHNEIEKADLMIRYVYYQGLSEVSRSRRFNIQRFCLIFNL